MSAHFLCFGSVLSHFGVDSSEYSVIFTSGATAAIKLVGEGFNYGDDGCLCYLTDNHTSILGIREYALRKRVKVMSVTPEQLHRTDDLSVVTGDGLYSFIIR